MYRHLTNIYIYIYILSQNLVKFWGLILFFKLDFNTFISFIVVYLTTKQKLAFVGITLCLWVPTIILTFKVNYLTIIVIRGYAVLKPIVGC